MRILNLFGFFNPLEIIKRCFLTIDPIITAALIGAGGSMLGNLFGGKDEEAPTYQYKEAPEVTGARSSLYTKLFNSPVSYSPYSAAQKQRQMGDIETQARRGAEGATFGVSRRGFRPEVGSTSTYDNLLRNIAGEETKQKTYLTERIAEIDAANKLASEQNRTAQQLGFLTGQESRATGESGRQYNADIYGYQQDQADTTDLSSLGSLVAQMTQGKDKDKTDIGSLSSLFGGGNTGNQWYTKGDLSKSILSQYP